MKTTVLVAIIGASGVVGAGATGIVGELVKKKPEPSSISSTVVDDHRSANPINIPVNSGIAAGRDINAGRDVMIGGDNVEMSATAKLELTLRDMDGLKGELRRAEDQSAAKTKEIGGLTAKLTECARQQAFDADTIKEAIAPLTNRRIKRNRVFGYATVSDSVTGREIVQRWVFKNTGQLVPMEEPDQPTAQ